ncbi:MAG: prenyltransferase [Bacteroidales bacterium]|jgi:1,4-dihydroxy-2-naphthoate octaprenyltransferase|nr:prenyltransferase [Bacteroidales bacterium]
MNTVLFWLKNARYVALPQSVMPAVMAVLLAVGSEDFKIIPALAAVVGAVVAHLGMNLADDYFDYRMKSDSVRNRLLHQGFRARIAKCDYLTSQTATPKQLLIAVFVFLAVAGGLGGIVMLYRGVTILYIAFVGLFLGIFYSCPPLKLSYLGLGDIVIGIMFGPLLMSGVYFAACGELTGFAVFASVPVGILVMNIIFTHSIMDRHADRAIGKMTFATLLTGNKALLTAGFMVCFAPFFVVTAGVWLGFMHWLYLAVFMVIPRAVWLFCSMYRFLQNEKAEVRREIWLGRMENWQRITASGLDWFMVRWYASRNLLTSFCFLMMVIHIILQITHFK